MGIWDFMGISALKWDEAPPFAHRSNHDSTITLNFKCSSERWPSHEIPSNGNVRAKLVFLGVEQGGFIRGDDGKPWDFHIRIPWLPMKTFGSL